MMSQRKSLVDANTRDLIMHTVVMLSLNQTQNTTFNCCIKSVIMLYFSCVKGITLETHTLNNN